MCYDLFMASRAPKFSEIIESSLAPIAPTPRPDLSLSQHTPVHRGKARWILSHHPKSATSNPTYPQWDIDNCTILGWVFNSMEDRIYHMFIYNDTVHSLWTTLSQMYAHAHHDSRIFELYQEIARASQETLGLSVADYFGFLQSRWEELAQYESLSDFPTAIAIIVSQRLARQHTYQFLMDLKSEYESLHIQILNTSPLPSLYEAFAIIDGDERRRRIIQTSPAISSGSTAIADQMAFASTSSGPRSFGGKPICFYRKNIGHMREQYFKLHLELKGTSSKRKGKGPRTATIAETSLGHVPDLSHIQSQLGSLLQQQPSGSTATLAAGSYIGCSGSPQNLHSPPSAFRLRPLCHSFSVSDTSPSHLVPPSVSPRDPSRTCHPPDRLIAKYMSYQGLSTSYQSFLGQVASIPIPRSVSEALQNLQWVVAMQEEMDVLEMNDLMADALFSVYVDDIIITEDDAPGIITVKQALQNSFDIKDLGHLQYFLGIETARSPWDQLIPVKVHPEPSPRYRMWCHASQMWIMQGQSVTDAPPLDYVHSMATTFCREKVRSRLLCLILQLKQNIEPWLKVHVNSSGSARL
ncbi:hypothetical protein Acr_06g0007850 [Actinidia rufa]|uniref:Reverse transcriptase Ty1/copia-type domain-containing protein n=1 Tax=Actinidia rufa TaxID=165716 RepID=A0A7J0EQS1_9ERIC|nr:hypothetical protein Acr_06g0007850 [Actinidia rufa]